MAPRSSARAASRWSRACRCAGSSSSLHRPAAKPKAPLLLMSYLNPLLAYGIDRLPEDAVRAGISGFIVPDLPYEECAELRAALSARDIALVQFVTPVTPIERAKMLSEASQGFLYAVTMTGTTGKNVAVPQEVLDYFSRVRELSPVPVVRRLRHPQPRAGGAARAPRRWRHRRFRAGRGARARRRPRRLARETCAGDDSQARSTTAGNGRSPRCWRASP